MTREEVLKICEEARAKGERPNLINANLFNADLINANLTDADLRNANLFNADLRNANLHRSALRSADLCNADLPCRIIQIGPIGSRKSQTVYDATHDAIRCGCFTGTIDEFAAKVAEEHGETRHWKEYNAMIVFLRTMREIEEEK